MKKPVVVEAVQLSSKDFLQEPEWFRQAVKSGEISVHQSTTYYVQYVIKTLEDGVLGEAKHIADINDWIIRGVKGELYACKPDIFELTYQRVVD